MGIICTLAISCAAVVAALVVHAIFDLVTWPRSRFYTLRTLIMAYLLRRILGVLAVFKWRQFQKDVHHYREAQERFVLKQIRDNENTDYGRDHGFARIRSLADFRRLHPVTEYSHYATYVERAEQGHTDAILGRASLLMFACSSGTTGKAKHIPISSATQGALSNMVGAVYGLQGEFRDRKLMKKLQIQCLPRWRYAKCGLPIGPLSGLFMKKEFTNTHWATPFAANVIDTEAEAMYVSLLFGLRDRDLDEIEAGFASGLYNILQHIENHWQDLAADIRTGRLKEDLSVTQRQRDIINDHLIPDPARATEIETECKKGMNDILPRLFPNLWRLSALCSGTSMSLYKQRCLPYLGRLQVHSRVYGSSEAFMGLNCRSANQDPAYVMVPSMAFVEYLPVDETGLPEEGQQPVMADEVQIGKLYEIVVTNCAGFYRYRLGDVVKVVDFYHQAPCVDFQFRAGQLLNVHNEKLSEESFFKALQTAVARWPGVTLRDFTSAESVLDPAPRPGPPYYLVFLELEQGEVTQEQRDMIDEALCEQNYVYKSFRVKDSIGPMKVMVVSEGSFAAFRTFQFNTTTAFMLQYKQPRVLRNPKQVQFLTERVIQQ